MRNLSKIVRSILELYIIWYLQSLHMVSLSYPERVLRSRLPSLSLSRCSLFVHSVQYLFLCQLQLAIDKRRTAAAAVEAGGGSAGGAAATAANRSK